MSELPNEWLWLSGLFFALGSLLVLVLIVVALYSIRVLADLSRQVHSLTEKVEGIAERVDDIAKTVQTVTTEVGVRTSGIVRTVDNIAGGTFDFLEKFAPLFMLLGAIWRLRARAKKV